MKSVKRFILDLQSTQSQISIPVALGDSAREWHISFSNGGEKFILEDGVLAKLEIKRPTGTHATQFCSIINGTTVVYEFDEKTAVAEGINRIDVILYDTDGKQIGSPHFAMVVSERVINRDDINLSDDDLTAIDAIVAAEAVRVANETIRVNAEAGRVNAETSRETAEQARQTATNEAIKRIDNKTADVEAKVNSGYFDGADGKDGQNGADGYSPTITTQEIAGGYTLTIVDKNGTKSINVMNGTNGEAGEDGTVADYTISMELDRSTYELTLKLKDTDGTIISEDVVDFPIENVVVSGNEEDGIVTLTLVNGNTIEFEIGDLVDGLVSAATFETTIKRLEDSIKASELASNKVTSLSSASTDVQYPSAKCVFNAISTAIANAITTTLNTEV